MGAHICLCATPFLPCLACRCGSLGAFALLVVVPLAGFVHCFYCCQRALCCQPFPVRADYRLKNAGRGPGAFVGLARVDGEDPVDALGGKSPCTCIVAPHMPHPLARSQVRGSFLDVDVVMQLVLSCHAPNGPMHAWPLVQCLYTHPQP